MENNTVRESNKYIKWIGTAFTLVGVYAVSISPTLAAESVGLFGMFFVAHIAWSVYGYQVKEKSLIWMNLGMIPLDVYAMWIRI